MSNKEKLLRVYQALNTIPIAGEPNIKTLAGVFSILEDVIADLEKAEKQDNDKGGEADNE